MSWTYDPVASEYLGDWIPRCPHRLDFTMRIESADVCFVGKPDHQPHIHVPHPEEKTVIFLRHGQSEANVMRDEVGFGPNNPIIRDARLTERGKSQAQRIANMVKAWNVDCVIVSPLSRALQTFGYAFDDVFRDPDQRDPQVIISPLVTEFYPNQVENVGRTLDDLLNDPEVLQVPIFSSRSLHDPFHLYPSRLFEEISRQYRALDPEWWEISGDFHRLQRLCEMIHGMPFKRIAVVAHWGLIHAVLSHLPHAPYPWKGYPRISNCNWIVTAWSPIIDDQTRHQHHHDSHSHRQQHEQSLQRREIILRHLL